MQTCGVCHTQSEDEALTCRKCGADLRRESLTARALARIRANPRSSKVRLMVNDDCCPACLEAYGTYDKDAAPILPIEGCSHPLGCRCFYQPELTIIYP